MMTYLVSHGLKGREEAATVSTLHDMTPFIQIMWLDRHYPYELKDAVTPQN